MNPHLAVTTFILFSPLKARKLHKMPPNIILSINDLKTYFYTNEGTARAVDGVSLTLKEGQTLGIVGESGCGKSVTALSIMRLIPQPPGKIVHGEILFEGRNIVELSEEEIRELRGKQISMIFQEPMTSLNPVFSVGDQIAEAIYCHGDVDKKEAYERSISILEKVGFPDPSTKAKQYPHQLSGGLRQRVMIAMALACSPKLLIADEPTTALDVTIQAQILDLLQDIREKENLSLIFVSHDLAVIAAISRDVAVMYAGQVVEKASVEDIFKEPLHPYTEGLLLSVPRVDQKSKGKRLYTIPGMVPSPTSWPEGCRFHNRCKYAFEKCFNLPPPYLEVEEAHWVRCWLRIRGENV